MGLFSWIASWFDRGDPLDLYKPRKRAIFTYFNGKDMVKGDPMVLYRNLEDVRGDLAAAHKVANSPSKGAKQAFLDMVRYIRTIFDLKPLAEGGLSEPEVLELFDRFLVYCDHVKKNSSPHTTSAEVPLPNIVSSSTASPPTPNSSDSGSTAGEASTEPPVPSPSVPASPSA